MEFMPLRTTDYSPRIPTDFNAVVERVLLSRYDKTILECDKYSTRTFLDY